MGCHTKVKDASLPNYLSITRRRIAFSWELVKCEMQSASFRIWTRVAESISYDDSRYTRSAYSLTQKAKSSKIFKKNLLTLIEPSHNIFYGDSYRE